MFRSLQGLSRQLFLNYYGSHKEGKKMVIVTGRLDTTLDKCLEVRNL